jgi:hypothetical protein
MVCIQQPPGFAFGTCFEFAKYNACADREIGGRPVEMSLKHVAAADKMEKV